MRRRATRHSMRLRRVTVLHSHTLPTRLARGKSCWCRDAPANLSMQSNRIVLPASPGLGCCPHHGAPCAAHHAPSPQILRAQGQFRKARHCEICKQQYRIPSSRPGCGRGSKAWELIKDLVSSGLQPQRSAIPNSLALWHARRFASTRTWQRHPLPHVYLPRKGAHETLALKRAYCAQYAHDPHYPPSLTAPPTTLPHLPPPSSPRPPAPTSSCWSCYTAARGCRWRTARGKPTCWAAAWWARPSWGRRACGRASDGARPWCVGMRVPQGASHVYSYRGTVWGAGGAGGALVRLEPGRCGGTSTSMGKGKALGGIGAGTWDASASRVVTQARAKQRMAGAGTPQGLLGYRGSRRCKDVEHVVVHEMRRARDKPIPCMAHAHFESKRAHVLRLVQTSRFRNRRRASSPLHDVLGVHTHICCTPTGVLPWYLPDRTALMRLMFRLAPHPRLRSRPASCCTCWPPWGTSWARPTRSCCGARRWRAWRSGWCPRWCTPASWGCWSAACSASPKGGYARGTHTAVPRDHVI